MGGKVKVQGVRHGTVDGILASRITWYEFDSCHVSIFYVDIFILLKLKDSAAAKTLDTKQGLYTIDQLHIVVASGKLVQQKRSV